jgi:hypothetical protein
MTTRFILPYTSLCPGRDPKSVGSTSSADAGATDVLGGVKRLDEAYEEAQKLTKFQRLN